MILTANEVQIIPSAVAAIAIVAGYFGVRSANNNGLKLAREERLARRGYELTELKRAAYAHCLEVMYELEIATLLANMNAASNPKGRPAPELLERQTRAYSAALNSSGQMKLFGPNEVIALTNDLMVAATQATPSKYESETGPSPFNRAQAQLIAAMVASLEGREITQEVLARGVKVATLGPQTQPGGQGWVVSEPVQPPPQ